MSAPATRIKLRETSMRCILILAAASSTHPTLHGEASYRIGVKLHAAARASWCAAMTRHRNLCCFFAHVHIDRIPVFYVKAVDDDDMAGPVLKRPAAAVPSASSSATSSQAEGEEQPEEEALEDDPELDEVHVACF